ncbi:TolC family outer membrane protein [Xanthobacter autotrophicus]|uniref:TolC family outer membrane protein n=1 Tax=Xanthobacter autotrophicus TaxID=280 RepID=UPI0024A74EEE|nr:TolC family outer membrane protein [Xanthobacter autotrophicus]MDI4657610.1 TolC family outer membrane protein [Xanthobacter autotrophicus]
MAGASIIALGMGSASSQSLDAALAMAYVNNPTLNSQRAGTRAVDERVPQALSGYRPTLGATASAGPETYRYQPTGSAATSGNAWPRQFALTAAYTLFNGFTTANQTRTAESQVRGSRETLRNTEQSVMLNGVTAYMNVIQAIALLDLQRKSLAAFEQELRATRDRFNVGEVTRTDVAQAEARVADAQYQVSQAVANLSSARAVYRQVIGVEPGKLFTPRSIEGMLPSKVDRVISSGLAQHPAIKASEFAVDAAVFQVKVAEGALLPNLSLQGQLSQAYDSSIGVERVGAAAATLNLSVPIYQGGVEYANIRQAKELLSQARIDVDVNRDAIRAQAVQYWGALEAAKVQIQAAQASVAANTLALEGVREEWRVGQRTTTDVLNAQRDLTNSQSALVVAQRDRVVAAYSLVSIIGRLDAVSLGLKVDVYNPQVHYNQVRDSWAGVRTPDGK